MPRLIDYMKLGILVPLKDPWYSDSLYFSIEKTNIILELTPEPENHYVKESGWREVLKKRWLYGSSSGWSVYSKEPPLSFEEAWGFIPKEIQEKMLYNLDLFR